MKTNYEPIEMKIAELRPRMKRLKVTFKVIEKDDEREVEVKHDKSTHRVADALVADETGSIIMPLWDDLIDDVEVDKIYTLSNGYTTTFQDSLRLNAGKYGEVSPAEEEIEEPNTDKDMSDTDMTVYYYRGKGT